MFFKALYFALEQTNVGDFCFRPKQIEILLNVWHGNNVVGLLPTGHICIYSKQVKGMVY